MPSRAAYLRYLSQHGLEEKDVLPILNLPSILRDHHSTNIIKGEGDFETPVRVGHLLRVYQIYDLISQVTEDVAVDVLMKNKFNLNYVLHRIFKNIKNSLLTIGLEVPETIFPGVYPTNKFNAICTPFE